MSGRGRNVPLVPHTPDPQIFQTSENVYMVQQQPENVYVAQQQAGNVAGDMFQQRLQGPQSATVPHGAVQNIAGLPNAGVPHYHVANVGNVPGIGMYVGAPALTVIPTVQYVVHPSVYPPMQAPAMEAPQGVPLPHASPQQPAEPGAWVGADLPVPAPAESPEAAPSAPPPLVEESFRSVILRGAANTSVPGLALAMLSRLRLRQAEVLVDAMGNKSVAVVMRAFVHLGHQDPAYTYFAQPGFARSDPGHKNMSHPSLRVTVWRAPPEPSPDPAVPTQAIVVKDDGAANKIAGVVARYIRTGHRTQQGPVLLLQCGTTPRSINVSAKSAALARLMLERDGLDLTLHPTTQSQEALCFYINTILRGQRRSRGPRGNESK